MTDQEQLELAAKAAGIEVIGDALFDFGYGIDVICPESGNDMQWNPLKDYGDALQLAVKLNLSIQNGEQDLGVRVWFVRSKDGLIKVHEFSRNNPERAVCRAIVRAAAEIGKGMK